MRLVIINEVLPPKDADIFFRLAVDQIALCQAPQTGWDTVFDSVQVVNDLGVVKTYKEKSGEAPAYLTERKSIAGDAGYHNWNDALKIPYAYCSLKNSRYTWGFFHYPLVVLAHKIGTLLFPTRTFGKFTILSQGLATAFIHEVFEMIGNKDLKAVSGQVAGTTLDLKDEAIFMENADPVARNLIDWIDPITKQNVAVTNFVWKKWYNRLSLGQVDQGKFCKGPFDVPKGGYLYQVLAGWKFRRVV